MTFYDSLVRRLRSELTLEDEGSLWLLFLDGERVLTAAAIAHGTLPTDDNYWDALAQVFVHLPGTRILFVVPRADLDLRPEDVTMWQRLRSSAAGLDVELVDCLIVNYSAWRVVPRTLAPSAAA